MILRLGGLLLRRRGWGVRVYSRGGFFMLSLGELFEVWFGDWGLGMDLVRPGIF